jgi:hypothetical protein
MSTRAASWAAHRACSRLCEQLKGLWRWFPPLQARAGVGVS